MKKKFTQDSRVKVSDVSIKFGLHKIKKRTKLNQSINKAQQIFEPIFIFLPSSKFFFFFFQIIFRITSKKKNNNFQIILHHSFFLNKNLTSLSHFFHHITSINQFITLNLLFKSILDICYQFATTHLLYTYYRRLIFFFSLSPGHQEFQQQI